MVRFFGQRTQGNTHYLLLEYADGGELFDRIGEGGREREADDGRLMVVDVHVYIYMYMLFS